MRGRILQPNLMFDLIYRQDNYLSVGLNMDFKFFVDRVNKVLYVFFQHSRGALDWFHNILTTPSRKRVQDGQGWFVHAGFSRVWRSGNDHVLGQLEHWLERPQFRDFIVVFGGFSHGAPLAQLAAREWFERTGRRHLCICFGSPRLAWGIEALRVIGDSQQLINWVNPGDPVTHVPLTRWGFQHVRENIVNVRHIPVLSFLRPVHHHEIYTYANIYPENWEDLLIGVFGEDYLRRIT